MEMSNQKHAKKMCSVEDKISQFKSEPTCPLKQLLHPKNALLLYHQPLYGLSSSRARILFFRVSSTRLRLLTLKRVKLKLSYFNEGLEKTVILLCRKC